MFRRHADGGAPAPNVYQMRQ
ncbi:MAG: hypothetical protein H6Q36_1382, partial [Chloroflexi bacterium]|nr:hypothetical protein [Chloroflexota bacterium]